MGRYVYTEKDVIDAIFAITKVRYHNTRPPISTGCLNLSSRKDFLARRAGKSLPTLTNVFLRVRRTASFVGFCGRNPWATLSHIANFEAASKPSSVNREITGHWVKTGLPGSSSVIQNYLPRLENARKLPDLTGLPRRRSIGISISGRTSMAGSSLRIRLT